MFMRLFAIHGAPSVLPRADLRREFFFFKYLAVSYCIFRYRFL